MILEGDCRFFLDVIQNMSELVIVETIKIVNFMHEMENASEHWRQTNYSIRMAEPLLTSTIASMSDSFWHILPNDRFSKQTNGRNNSC